MPNNRAIEANDDSEKIQKQLEVYKQLHETCRHHYRLEWQLLQVGVIAAIGVLTFRSRNGSSDLGSWLLMVSGFALMWISYAMHRQSSGYLRALKHLLCYADLMRDPNVRWPGKAWQSAAVQGRWILLFVGVALCQYGVWKCFPGPEWLRLPLCLIWAMIFSYVLYVNMSKGKEKLRGDIPGQNDCESIMH